MRNYHISKHNSFYAVGLSYKKADAEVRGKFSLDVPAIDHILVKAKELGIDGLLAISTCNRTELYGFAQHPYQLIKLLCDQTHGTVEEFQEVAYVYKNHDAISHMFKVGTGLDSQIPVKLHRHTILRSLHSHLCQQHLVEQIRRQLHIGQHQLGGLRFQRLVGCRLITSYR